MSRVTYKDRDAKYVGCVFRGATELILKEFVCMGERIAQNFVPKGVTNDEAFALSVERDHIELLAKAMEIADHAGSRYYMLKTGMVGGFILKFQGRTPHETAYPNYAKAEYGDIKHDWTTSAIKSAPREVISRMLPDLEKWLDLAVELRIAHKMFVQLNKTNMTREQLRYIYPPIVTLLERAAKRHPDDRDGPVCHKYHNALAETNARYHTYVDPSWRDALQLSGEIIGRLSLLEERPYITTADECSIQVAHPPVSHPAWMAGGTPVEPLIMQPT